MINKFNLGYASQVFWDHFNEELYYAIIRARWSKN